MRTPTAGSGGGGSGSNYATDQSSTSYTAGGSGGGAGGGFVDITCGGTIRIHGVIDASERIWDTLENYKEVIEGLESTNESVLSHSVNDTLRVLTSITVIVLPLTLLASVFGMNVAFPGEGQAIAFIFIIVAMFLVFLGMAVFFRMRGWL